MKIIIIGKANGWENAPQEGETWGVHSLCLRRPLKMVFDMHKIEGTNEERGCTFEEQLKIVEYVNDNKVPYMTLNKYEGIPTSIKFPIEEMIPKYSESSISYMIWYACYIGADEIEIYGVNMSNFDEYHEQLKSTDYWIGYARGKGIKVTVAEPTAICKGQRGLYGYDYVDPPHPVGSVYQGKVFTREDWEEREARNG
jgi:hypothetical protein